MSKTYAFLLALISIVEVCAQEPIKSADQGVTLGDFFVKHSKWIVADGEQAKRIEEERIKAKMGSPAFIREELLREYIDARRILAYRQAEIVFILTTTFKESELEHKNRIVDSTNKAIEEQHAKVLRILDMLSRLPVPDVETPSPPLQGISR